MAIPADILMIYYLQYIDKGRANSLMMFMFGAILTSSSVNAFFYIGRLLGIIESMPFASIRSIVSNLFITSTAWVFVFFVAKLHKKD